MLKHMTGKQIAHLAVGLGLLLSFGFVLLAVLIPEARLGAALGGGQIFMATAVGYGKFRRAGQV
jgi:hypothetical protein